MPTEPATTAITLYGLNHCDTCKKARKWLDAAGLAHQFIDYRQHPIAAETLKAWAASLGWDALINRAGSTWRNLPANRKQPGTAAEYLLLVREYPSLLRRPITLWGERLQLGFSHGLYEKLRAQA